MSKLKKKVAFNDEVTCFSVPRIERMGTWKIDSDRFRMRIITFEKLYINEVLRERENSREILGEDNPVNCPHTN